MQQMQANLSQEQLQHNEPNIWDEIKRLLKVIAENTNGPVYVNGDYILDEYQFANGTSVTLNPNIDRPALITSFIASIPSGTSGILTIGAAGQGGNKRQINISPNTPLFNSITMIIYPNDQFNLTITGGTGNVSLEIMGGILRKGDWRNV